MKRHFRLLGCYTLQIFPFCRSLAIHRAECHLRRGQVSMTGAGKPKGSEIEYIPHATGGNDDGNPATTGDKYMLADGSLKENPLPM